MKKLIFLLFTTSVCFGQIQIGSDIIGTEIGDRTGRGLALSSDGQIMAIGSPRNSDGSGLVKVFENVSGAWIQVGDDIVGGPDYEESGSSLDLSSDGSILAVGAPANSDAGTQTGQVRVYENIAGVWTQLGQNINGEPNPRDAHTNELGYSLDLSSDGTVLAIGAPENPGDNFRSGHVQVYKYESNLWVQIGDDIDGDHDNSFSGTSVSVSSNGQILAIGSPGYDPRDNLSAKGRVRVLSNEQGVWTNVGGNILGEKDGDNFGESVSISDDGSILAVGAPHKSQSSSDTPITDNGYVKVFKNIDGVWVQIGTNIIGDNPADRFGFFISMSGNGEIIGIGASCNDSIATNAGQVKVYQNFSDKWTQIGEDIYGDAIDFRRFGANLVVSKDGSTISIGAAPFGALGKVKAYSLATILSLEQEVGTFGFNVYPNPSNGIINTQLGEIQIFNSRGELIIAQDSNGSIDVSTLTSGIYIYSYEGRQTRFVVE